MHYTVFKKVNTIYFLSSKNHFYFYFKNLLLIISASFRIKINKKIEISEICLFINSGTSPKNFYFRELIRLTLTKTI